MNENPLGKLITDDQHRDAVHVAIVPVVAAGDPLRPGKHIAIDENGQSLIPLDREDCIGIIDPFLQQTYIEKGQTFWLLLYPNSVTGMRHHWSHPAFNDKDDDETEEILNKIADNTKKGLARKFIETMAAEASMSYDEMLDAGELYARDGDYTHCGDDEGYGMVPYEKWPKYWEHIQTLTGESVANEDGSPIPFSCAC